MKPQFKILNVALSTQAYDALQNYKITRAIPTHSLALEQILLAAIKEHNLPSKLIPKYKRREHRIKARSECLPEPIRKATSTTTTKPIPKPEIEIEF